jgi:NADH-quinone oxidoreductase subunit M
MMSFGQTFGLLSAITLLPLFFALAVLVAPKTWVRPFALVLALLEFALSLGLLWGFDKASPGLQFVEQYSWVPELGISYFLAVDGISLWLVLLTTFLLPLTILASWTSIDERVKGFHSCLFLVQTSMIGAFLAMDAILFYTFFELSLIPMFFMIGIWGGPRRVFATTKFFVFTMFGSLMMLLAIIYLMFAARDTIGDMTSNMLVLYRLKTPFVAGELMNPQTLLFFAFSLAFAIKLPIFPLHTWLPDAYAESPTPATVLLAGVMSKMASYGFIRLVIPLFPEAAEHYAWIFLFLGVVGIIYGAVIAMIQPDMKRLVAYSSISHIGFILIGLFSLNSYGVSGSLFQMLSHGVSTGALFLLVGMLYERTRSREISRFGGLAKAMPVFTIFFVVVTLSSIAVPMTNGFIGEFLILLGTFQANKWMGIFAVSGVILGAAYMLWMVKRVFFGQPGELVSTSHHPLRDLNARELTVLVPIVIVIFVMGLAPNLFLDYSKASVEHLVTTKDAYQLTEASDVPAAPVAPAADKGSVKK